MQTEPINWSTISATPAGFTHFRGGQAMLLVDGTFGGTTVTFAAQGPVGGNCTIAGISLTAAGAVPIALPAGDYKPILTGGAGISLSVRLIGVPGFM